MLKTISLTIIILFSLSAAALAQKPKPTPKPSKTLPPNKVAASSAAKCEGNLLTAAEITELLSAHNKARDDQKLPPLTWDCTLAKSAQDWASKSVFQHQDTYYGENMFVASSPTEKIETVTKQWMKEKSNWDNKTATCATGKTCTHYTQIMWNTTAKVGCGINRNATGKWKVIVVCNYDPAGNSGGPAY